MSLDGFIAGPTGDIGWTAPEGEQFRFHIEQTRHVAPHQCGRELYPEMLVRETAEQTMFSEAELEFARICRPIPKVVISPHAEFGGRATRLATDDIATEVSGLRDRPDEDEGSIGGAGLAAAAIAEDLIDEYRLFVINLVILGGGTPYFTPLTEPLDLRLTESRTFSCRVVYLRLPTPALSLAPRNTSASNSWKGAVSQRSKKFL